MKCVWEKKKKKSAIFGNLWVKQMSNSSFPYTLMTPTHLLPSLAFLPSASAR